MRQRIEKLGPYLGSSLGVGLLAGGRGSAVGVGTSEAGTAPSAPAAAFLFLDSALRGASVNTSPSRMLYYAHRQVPAKPSLVQEASRAGGVKLARIPACSCTSLATPSRMVPSLASTLTSNCRGISVSLKPGGSCITCTHGPLNPIRCGFAVARMSGRSLLAQNPPNSMVCPVMSGWEAGLRVAV